MPGPSTACCTPSSLAAASPPLLLRAGSATSSTQNGRFATLQQVFVSGHRGGGGRGRVWRRGQPHMCSSACLLECFRCHSLTQSAAIRTGHRLAVGLHRPP
jgi:hypothetical protein